MGSFQNLFTLIESDIPTILRNAENILLQDIQIIQTCLLVRYIDFRYTLKYVPTCIFFFHKLSRYEVY